jgi:hypothetical protein
MDAQRRATLPARLGRVIWPHRNPLARGTDRLESATLVGVVLASLMLAPVTLVFGSIVHADMTATAGQQAATRHHTVAVLLADTPAAVGGHGTAAGAGGSKVLAEWRLPDGTTRTGRVVMGDGLSAGARVGIWLDDNGNVVDRPVSEADAMAGGAMVALAGWVTAVGLLVLAQVALHLTLNRRRYRAWDRQWARVEPGWNADRC